MTKTNLSPEWPRIFFGARTRILAWYVALVALSSAVSVLALRPSLYGRLEERIEESLTQEIEEFHQLVMGTNPSTGQPFGENVAAIFDVFLSRNVPDDDEFLLTLVNGQFYKSSPRALPVALQPDSDLVNHLAQLTRTEQGEIETTDDTILYRAEPLKIRGKTQGVFVVAHALTGEQEEVNEAVVTVFEVGLAGWVIATMLAWFAAGRILAPLRSLTATALSISESDLSQRIPVRGSGEIAKLTMTFNEMMDRLEAAFASQRDFINDAGHELRTPITIIRGHLELMGDDPEEQRETLELVIDELDRMSRFVDDLILLAKSERPNFLISETVEIGSLSEELYAKAKVLAARRDWRLESKGAGRLVADRQRLTQAIMNLAENATQHTIEDDTIALGTALNNSGAYFWVRDTGKGIALVDQQRIFERFARASSQRRQSEGAGLGLAIVRAIAEAHGGRVELRSQAGVGSTFTLILPLEPPSRGPAR